MPKLRHGQWTWLICSLFVGEYMVKYYLQEGSNQAGEILIGGRPRPRWLRRARERSLTTRAAAAGGEGGNPLLLLHAPGGEDAGERRPSVGERIG